MSTTVNLSGEWIASFIRNNKICNENFLYCKSIFFDFRYLFMVNKIVDINIDTEESANYKWISSDELSKITNY